jgi:hypothetical protein
MTATPPLLALAASKKARAHRAPVVRPKEITLHMSVAKLLREHCLPEWRWTHIASGELRDVRTAAKLKAMGVQRGWPDILLLDPNGRAHCLELKRHGEDLTDDQEAFQLWCIRNGVSHSVAWTIDDALTALDAWRCLRIKIGGSR